MTQPEPWLRGTMEGLHPAAAHLLYTFEQAREELALYCSGLFVEDIWKSPRVGVASLGFHLRHIAGSVDRLTTYLRGEELTDDQLECLREEQLAGPGFGDLMAAIEVEFRKTEEAVRGIGAETFGDPRWVGRKRLPTTVGGLIVHMAEHTQRHLGQAVLMAKLV